MIKYLDKSNQFTTIENDECNENNGNILNQASTNWFFLNHSLPISYNYIMLIYIHFYLSTYHLHIPLALVLTYELAWFYSSISVKSFRWHYDMNHSSTTQAVSEGQLVRKNHNANLARNSQSINFPEPYAANKFKRHKL